MTHCIYCRTEGAESDFTLEHVVPQFLGGAYAPDFLKTRDVCRSCNSNLGLFVDASFEKNWIVSNWLRDSSSAFYNKECPVGVSLVCMGISDLRPSGLPEDHVCELWLGPLGEQVYWLRPHDLRMPAYIGGNPRTTKRTETRAYFLFSENSKEDPIKAWLSFEQAFQGRKVKKIMCTEIRGADPATIGFAEPDDLDRSRIMFFLKNSKNEPERKLRVTVNPRFDLRFMCKIAIGFAYCLFGSKVLASDYGNELNKGLWYREGDEEPKVLGSALFAKQRDPTYNRIAGFPNSVVIVLSLTPEGVAINLNVGAKLNWTVLCAPNDVLTLKDINLIGDGQVILLARSIREGIHLDLPSYLSHILNIVPHPELNKILERSRAAVYF
ncbi:MAG: HNH endonuclease [Pseudomonadales bacterium]